jgi:hypothetical protein
MVKSIYKVYATSTEISERKDILKKYPYLTKFVANVGPASYKKRRNLGSILLSLSPEDILDLAKRFEIILSNDDGKIDIEIYDDYRE